ncbi:MAG: hypothetical protein HUJ26_19010 [Planctomycetaceae bacterium]|nr:hypothetical protein [Planctomycetaceae bacterium]
MPLNEWRGDAVPQAQIVSVSFANAETGDIFGIEINGKQIQVVSNDEDEGNVADAIVEAIDESTIPEFVELSAVASGSSVILTANTPGYPFEISAFTINSSSGAKMSIEVTSEGVTKVNEVQEIDLDGTYTSTAPGTFTLDHPTFTGGPTSAIDADATAAELKAEIVATFTEVSSSDLDVTGGGLGGPWYITWKGSFAESEVDEFTVDGSSLSPDELSVVVDTVQNGYGGADTVYLLTTARGVDYQTGTYTLTVNGVTSSDIAFDATPAQLQSALESIATVGAGNVVVEGYVSTNTNTPGAAYAIRFTEDFAGVDVTMTVDPLGLAINALLEKVVEGGAESWSEIQVLDYGGYGSEGGAAARWRLSQEGTTNTYQGFSQLYYWDGVSEFSGPGINYAQEASASTNVEGFWSADLQQLELAYGVYFSTTINITGRHFIAGDGMILVFEGPSVDATNVNKAQVSAGSIDPSNLARTPQVFDVQDGGSGTGSEIQTVWVQGSGNTWTLSLDGETTASIAYGASAATVKSAIETAFTGINTVTVTGTGTLADPYVVTFDDPGASNINEMTGDGTNLTGGSGNCFELVSHVVGANEVQTITIEPSVTGGTFKLSFGGYLTGEIAYDASAAVVEAALAALESIGTPTSPNVSVTGADGGPWTVTFDGGSLAKKDVALLGFDDFGLEGGAGTQTATVTRTTDSLGPNHLDDPLNWSQGRVPDWGDDIVFESENVSALYYGEWVAEFTAEATTGGAEFTIPWHSFNNRNQKVRLFTTDTLPTGLSTGTDYYVIPVDQDTIKLSETEDGDAVEITDTGTGTHTIAVHINSIKTHNRYTGGIGLSEWNDNEYKEYRPLYMKVGLLSTGDKQVLVGVGEGSGQPRLKLDMSDTQANVKVLSTGGSQESGVPTMLLLNNNSSTNIEVIDGDVGCAFHEGETSTFNKLTLRGGSMRLGDATFSEIDWTGGEFFASEATLNGPVNVNG